MINTCMVWLKGPHWGQRGKPAVTNSEKTSSFKTRMIETSYLIIIFDVFRVSFLEDFRSVAHDVNTKVTGKKKENQRAKFKTWLLFHFCTTDSSAF